MHATNGHSNGTHNGRTGNGRFAFGNGGGPGRPARPTEASYLAALVDECSPEVWRRIIRRAVADALDGNSKARDFVARYLLGNPAELLTLAGLKAIQEQEDKNHERTQAADSAVG